MCQYFTGNGRHYRLHLTQLGGIVHRGPALTIIEATAVAPEGHITPEDSGLWVDSQIESLKRLSYFAQAEKLLQEK